MDKQRVWVVTPKNPHDAEKAADLEIIMNAICEPPTSEQIAEVVLDELLYGSSMPNLSEA